MEKIIIKRKNNKTEKYLQYCVVSGYKFLKMNPLKKLLMSYLNIIFYYI